MKSGFLLPILPITLATPLLAAGAGWLVLRSPVTLGEAGGQCTAALTAAGPDNALPGQLEILSWNIQKASNTGWAEDLAELAGGIDLAFIQEASLQAQIPAVFQAPLHQEFAAGYTTGSQETGVMTLSSGSPSLHCNLTIREPWLGTPKATSVTQFALADREDRLLAINLHAVNFALGLEDFRRQFGALDELLANHQGPVILAGDLNTWSSQRQALVDEFAEKYGLGPVAFSPDRRSTAFGRALDHIYIRGMRPLAAQVIEVSTSDHNPLRVSLSLN